MDREKFAINQELKFLADTFKYDAVEINFLVELLNHSNLEIRAKAYHLLQNIDSEKVRNSRSQVFFLIQAITRRVRFAIAFIVFGNQG